MLPEGGEGGDAGDVTVVRAGRHVTEGLQAPLWTVVTHVAVEDGGCERRGLVYYIDYFIYLLYIFIIYIL